MLSDKRLQKITEAIAKRQWDLTVILENVHDPHNLGAVMRSCESIGITEVFILYTEATTNPDRYIGRNATGGVSKWIKSHFYDNMDECFNDVRKKYDKIYATHLREDSQSIYEKDTCTSMAFLFGNEHAGVSEAALARCDGNIMIPMQGLAESLNVSVACSIMLYETMRQRIVKGLYNKKFDRNDPMMSDMLNTYVRKTKPRIFSINPQVLYDQVDDFLLRKSKLDQSIKE
jgi:tRNA (guanosine-2'-O-)-methyltransferase